MVVSRVWGLVAFVLTIALVCILTSSRASAARICADGGTSHLASQEEADAASPKGSIVVGVTEICPGDAKAGISADAGSAKEYLRSIVCPKGSYGGLGADGTVSGLDNKFAICAAKFLKSESQSGISVCLNEGARSVAKQNEYADNYRRGGGIACTRGAACEHPRGVAIDVNTTSEANYAKLHADAKQFGLIFYLGFRDKVHFVPIRNSSDCNAGGVQQPEFYDYPQYYPAQQQTTPMNNLQNMFTPQPQIQPLTQQQMTQPAPAPTPINYPPSQTQSTLSNLLASTSTLSISETPSMATSSVDLLNALANPPTTSSQTVSASPLVLNIGDSIGAQLIAPPPSNVVPTHVVVATEPASQQTFTSGDLGGNGAPYSSAQYSGLQLLLANMKTILLNLLNYLRPFGGVVPAQQQFAD